MPLILIDKYSAILNQYRSPIPCALSQRQLRQNYNHSQTTNCGVHKFPYKSIAKNRFFLRCVWKYHIFTRCFALGNFSIE